MFNQIAGIWQDFPPAFVFLQRMLRLFFIITITLLLYVPALSQKRLRPTYSGLPPGISVPRDFGDSIRFVSWLQSAPSLLADQGWWEARLDSFHIQGNEAAAHFFSGPLYEWEKLQLDTSESGLNFPLHLPEGKLHASPDSIIRYIHSQLERKGYPFGTLSFDSLHIQHGKAHGVLSVRPGLPYRFIGIEQAGSVQLEERFLYRYLELTEGSALDAGSLAEIDRKLYALGFAEPAQPSEWDMLANGGRLKVFLRSTRNNNVNVIIGAMPQPQSNGRTRMLLTGDADIHLRNALGRGEAMQATWQQLQPKSPRLNLAYNQWYIFKSRFGFDSQFELYKQDSQFLQIRARIGIPYQLGNNKSVSVFYQWQKNVVGEVDTNKVKNTRTLPAMADFSVQQLGIAWKTDQTDYPQNPRSGFRAELNLLGGLKQVVPNGSILALKTADFDYARLYDTVRTKSQQFTALVNLEKYSPLNPALILKNSLHGGWIHSPQYFRNELFRLGGFHLLRGFDEQSIFASAYAVTTAELRWLTGRNSFLFAFADAGITRYAEYNAGAIQRYLGSGLGLQLEAGSTLVQISVAAGKQSHVPFSLRQTKIHVGFTNRF